MMSTCTCMYVRIIILLYEAWQMARCVDGSVADLGFCEGGFI